MDITKVVIRMVEGDTKLKATATVTLNDCFVINDVKVVMGEKGLFVAMPSKHVGTTYKDICHPINQKTREMFENAILKEYNK